MISGSALPFGFRFLEDLSSDLNTACSFRYDDELGCSVVNCDGKWQPIVTLEALLGLTQIITEQTETPQDGEGEHDTSLSTLLFTQTSTKAKPEDIDDDNETRFFLSHSLTVTVTRSREEPEEDDNAVDAPGVW